MHSDKMSDDDKEAYGDYENKMRAEHSLETLVKAKEIRADGDLMKMVRHCAEKQLEASKATVKDED